MKNNKYNLKFMIDINNDIKFKSKVLKTGEKYEINGIEIITVVNGEVFEIQKGTINDFESSVFYNGFLEAKKETLITVISVKENDIILNKINIDEKFGNYCRGNWVFGDDLFPGCGLDKSDLYRSNQIEELFSGIKYKFNFWFCGPDTNCGIHNTHDFVETHTNVAGDGFMQKFDNKNEDSLIETVGLMPGSSHRRFDINGENNKNNNPKYPYHRWLGGKTGNIWLVIEKY